MVKATVHRHGVPFSSFPFYHLLQSGMICKDGKRVGYICWGLLNILYERRYKGISLQRMRSRRSAKELDWADGLHMLR